MRIIQLCESLSYGDGMSNHSILLHRALKDAGMQVETYSQCINQGVSNENIKQYTGSIDVKSDDVVLLQFGLGGPIAREIEKFKCRRMMYYHNITPPHFFRLFNQSAAIENKNGYDLVRKWARQGTFECVLTCSKYNGSDLLSLGFPEKAITCLPGALMLLPQKNDEIDSKLLEKYSDGHTNILFVGRIAPNKRQEDVIAAYAYYKKHIDPNARLFLVGSGADDAYGVEVKKYVNQIGDLNVIFPGHLSDAQVMALYQCADVFLCMSEHEGFCNPLIEAMYFDVPVIAYSAAAVPGTLGGAGVLVYEKSPVLTAQWISKIINDDELRKQIIEKQRQRVKELSFERVSKATVEAIRYSVGIRQIV